MCAISYLLKRFCIVMISWCTTGILSGDCVNVNECEENDPCGDNADCTDTSPGFDCTCLEGFRMNDEGDACESKSTLTAALLRNELDVILFMLYLKKCYYTTLRLFRCSYPISALRYNIHHDICSDFWADPISNYAVTVLVLQLWWQIDFYEPDSLSYITLWHLVEF